jgi:hypothetical protein
VALALAFTAEAQDRHSQDLVLTDAQRVTVTAALDAGKSVSVSFNLATKQVLGVSVAG